jgi:capsular polysaccharide biosynthesis protein
VYQTKEVVQEVKQAIRRRMKLLIIIPIIFVGMSFVALYVITPRYMSSTSILVQKDETLNPLVLYEIAVNTVSQNRLESFNEIIFSRSTMEMLIDSLGLDAGIRTQTEKQQLIERLKGNIETTFKGSDSFHITYYDTDAVRARDGVELLASHFIQSRLRIENSRNNETVNFFSDKLVEMEQVVEQQRNVTENVQSSRVREQPVESEALQERLQSVEVSSETLNWQLYEQQQKVNTIRGFNASANKSANIQMLFKLPLATMPFGEDLSVLLNEYDQLSQQFTESYPRLRSLSGQIEQVVQRMEPVVESELEDLNIRQDELSRRKSELLNSMEQSYVATQRANTQQSDFSIYEGLLADIKVKLEQAKMSRDIGERAAEQFIVLDAPYIPERPTKPNKRMVVGIGLFLGLIVGVSLSAVAEAMDSTIRYEEDLPFNKPIIAYLSNG